MRLRTERQMLQRLALHRTAAAAAAAPAAPTAHPRVIRLALLAPVASAAEREVDVVARVAAPVARSLAGHHTRSAAAAAALAALRTAVGVRWVCGGSGGG